MPITGQYFLCSLLWILFVIFIAEPIRADCQPLTKERALNFSREAKEIVFFASWCMGCKEHLLAAQERKSVLVAVFDERKRAESALKGLGISENIACYWDETAVFSRRLGIEALPARIDLH